MALVAASRATSTKCPYSGRELVLPAAVGCLVQWWPSWPARRLLPRLAVCLCAKLGHRPLLGCCLPLEGLACPPATCACT